MATLAEQITAIENEIENMKDGQEIQSEHYRLKRARLKDLLEAKAQLKAEEISTTKTLGDRMRFHIPFRA